MAMSKKDYVAIAAIIKAAKEKATDNSYPRTETLKRAIDAAFADEVNELCGLFRKDNPRFDAPRFCDACGI